jgi:hypothetical protein
MTAGVLNRTIVASGITAAALCGLDAPAAARAQQVQNEQEEEKAPPQEKDKPQQYVEGLHQQRLRIQVQRSDDYGGDPYCYTAPSHRYARGGRYYETSQYGMEVLRQAVNDGDEQGRFAGMADQQDRWPYNCLASYAYQDANYGYGGFYVDRYDYNYYFRLGFRRGYDDGHYGRYHYGTYSDGRVSMLGPMLGGILVFEVIR